MFDPPVGELGEHLWEVEGAVGADEGARVSGDAFLDPARQHAGDHLAVDRVRDSDRCVRCDEPEVPEVGDVVVVGLQVEHVARQHRTEDLLDAGFGEPGRERVQMGRPGKDELFLRRLQMVDRDRLCHGNGEFFDGLAGECVDEPRLAGGQFVGVVDGAGGEGLAGLGGVLGVEVGDLVQGEVTEPQRLQLDVERAGGPQPGRVTPGGGPGDPRNREAISGAAVADVSQAAQRDGPGERGGAAVVAVAELAEDAEERLAAQRVDLVEEQDQWAWAHLCPRAQRVDDQCAVRRVRPWRWTQLGR